MRSAVKADQIDYVFEDFISLHVTLLSYKTLPFNSCRLLHDTQVYINYRLLCNSTSLLCKVGSSGIQNRKYKRGTFYPDLFVPDKTGEKDQKIELFCLFQGSKTSGYKIPVLYFLLLYSTRNGLSLANHNVS